MNNDFMNLFRISLFEGQLEDNFKSLFISPFNNWLDRGEYDQRIINADEDTINSYNNRRICFFSKIYKDCYYLNEELNGYYKFDDYSEFLKTLVENLDDSEGFTLVSKDNGFAVQTGYDYSDRLFFIDDGLVSFFEEKLKGTGLFIIKD